MMNSQKYPNHICRFNDPPQECDCYTAGREDGDKERWNAECVGCRNGHPSFWKTIVENEEWKLWEKEQSRRIGTKNMEGCFDYDESRECGWLGKEHWQSFIKFLIKKND